MQRSRSGPHLHTVHCQSHTLADTCGHFMTASVAYLALLSLYAIVYPADILKGNEHL